MAQPATLPAPPPPPAAPPAAAASLNPHRLSTQSSLSSSSAASSSTNGRLSPASTRLRIDVPPNQRFLRTTTTKALGAEARSAVGGAAETSSPRTSDEYGNAEGDGRSSLVRGLEADDSERGEDEDPPRTPITLPRSPRQAAEVPSDDEDDAFHDAREGDWFGAPGSRSPAEPVSLEPEGVGLGLGLPGPSTLSQLPRGPAPPQEGGRDTNAERKGRTHGSSESDDLSPQQRRGSLPFPCRAFAPVPSEVPSYGAAVSSTTGAPPRPSLASRASHSTDASRSESLSSTVSVPSAPPVDLALPNRTAGPFESVANGPMASLAAANAPASRAQPSSGGARSFLSSLLHRSPRSNSSPRSNPSPRFGSPSASSDGSPNPSIPRSPSAPHGWQHPSVASLQSNDPIHSRSTSMPMLSNGEAAPRDSSDLYRPPTTGQTGAPVRRTPRSIAAATFAGLTRSSSLRKTSSSSRSAGAASTSASAAPPPTASPVPTFEFATPPLPSSAPADPEPPSLASIGLSVVPLTQPLSLSRSGQPLCGAILDQKYLLIGTTTGLDFLPLPLPGSLPMQHFAGGKKRKDTRKPIALIKRTRFKELAVLSERSNILLAIAGRNDHIRVYALDGIRAMIDKKMQEVDARDGYPLATSTTKGYKMGSGTKGKERARTTSDSLSAPAPAPPARAPSAGYQFPPSSVHDTIPPPEQAAVPRPNAPAGRRRPPSWHQATNPTSPVRISRQPSSASIVRAVPTNPTNPPAPRGSISSQGTATNAASTRVVRPQKSREFIAGRRGSTATVGSRRRSRADLDSPTESRRTSVHSAVSRRGSARYAAEHEGAGGGTGSGASRRASVPAVPRLPGAMPLPLTKRMEPRPPVKTSQDPLERSPTSDLADFLRDSGPQMRSPEMDRLLASSRTRRRSSVTDNVLQTGANAQLFPTAKAARSAFERSQMAEQLAGLALYTTGDDGEMVEMLRSDAVALGAPPVPPKPRARGPTTPLLEPGQQSPSMELAALLRDTAPEDALAEPDEERGGAGAAAAAAAAREAALNRLEARSTGTSPIQGPREGSPSLEGTVGGSPSSPASKRWTMSAFGSKLLNRSSPVLDGDAPKRPVSSASHGSADWPPSSMSQWEMVPDARSLPPCEAAPPLSSAPPVAPPLPSAPSAAFAPPLRTENSDRKRRPAASLHRDRAPSQAPPDAHPASSASPLEYVKLARTKGARMLRAVETKKRTYLAVLSGEEGERIELFTGSRSISLSLNRTFVLPETPRTIEFQLQGDDLIDIYLIYGESIFALEPSTVRVREVGVGRGERRARRERERRLRTLATTTDQPLPAEAEGADEAPLPEVPSTLHPADHARQEQERADSPATDGAEGDDVAIPFDSTRRSPSPSPEPVTAMQPPATPPPGYDAPTRPRTTSSATSPARDPPLDDGPAPPPPTSSSRGKLPYTTFQQLPFVPPVPSSVLSSAWTIPPLYADVVASPAQSQSSSEEDPLQPSITVTGANGIEGDVEERVTGPPSLPSQPGLDIPLLSPVSLLGGAATRHTGPPGLFFVSKGQSISGIVTADGKSIIKRPLIWSQDQGPFVPDPECLQRLEVLVVGGTRTVVVKLSPSSVEAISVEGGSTPFSAAVPVTRPNARAQVGFLATHRAGQQLVFAQTVGPTTTIMCLAPSRA